MQLLFVCIFFGLGLFMQATAIEDDYVKLGAQISQFPRVWIYFHEGPRNQSIHYSTTFSLKKFNSTAKDSISISIYWNLIDMEPATSADAFRFFTENGGVVVVEPRTDPSDSSAFIYDVYFPQGISKEEALQMLLRLFARDKYYEELSIGMVDSAYSTVFSTSSTFRVEKLAFFVGAQKVDEPTILSLVQAVRPAKLELLEWVMPDGASLSDASFREQSVRKLKDLYVPVVARITDDTLADLKANCLFLTRARQLAPKGVRRWLDAVVNGEVETRDHFEIIHFIDGLEVMRCFDRCRKCRCINDLDCSGWLVKSKAVDGLKAAMLTTNEDEEDFDLVVLKFEAVNEESVTTKTFVHDREDDD